MSANKSALIYKHTPLDYSLRTIRVLEFQPDGTNSADVVLSVKLRCIELGAEDFVCLSYTWGSDLHPEPILVNNEPFSVYENVWLFLSVMRKRRFTLPLWIDLICIDQSNTLERNHQVHQMAEIYRTAHHVLVWLGESNAAQDELFTLLGAVSESLQSSASHDTEVVGSQCSQYKRLDVLEDHHWKAFSQLCYNSYWTRLWIVQEMVLARDITVVCGDYSLPWHLLLGFCTLVHTADTNRQKLGLRRRVTEELIQNILGLRHGHNAPLGLLEASARFGSQVCRDLRDHVYGVLGLTDDDADFPVNYEESASDLYKRVLEHEARKRDICTVPHGHPVHFSKGVKSALGLESMVTMPWIAVHGFELLRPVARVALPDFTSSTPGDPSLSVDFWVREYVKLRSNESTRLRPASASYEDIPILTEATRPSLVQHGIPDILPCIRCIDDSRANAANTEPSVFSRIDDPAGGHVYRWTTGPPPRLAGPVWLVTRVTIKWHQEGVRIHLDGIASEMAPENFQVILRRCCRSTAEKPVSIDLWILPACRNSKCYCFSSSGDHLGGARLLVIDGETLRNERNAVTQR